MGRDTRDPFYLCPLCEHPQGETVCPKCTDERWAKCGCCEEYRQHLATQPWACGCADDTLLCKECRDNTAQDECNACSAKRRPLAGIDYPRYAGTGGGLS